MVFYSFFLLNNLLKAKNLVYVFVILKVAINNDMLCPETTHNLLELVKY